MKTYSPWTPTLGLRILLQDGKRTLQQRWTRIAYLSERIEKDTEYVIEERWENVPTVEEDH